VLDLQEQRTLNLEHAKYLLIDQPDIAGDFKYVTQNTTFNVSLPPKLMALNMSGALRKSGSAATITLHNATHMRSIDMSYIRIFGCNFIIHGLENLEVLNLSGNDCYETSKTFLDSFPRLKVLAMKKMAFAPGLMANKGRRLFQNVTGLVTLDLSFNDLRPLPSDLLSRQLALEELFLVGNNMESFDLDLCYHKNLTLLDLSGNRLSVLSEAAQNSLDSLVAGQHQPLQLHLHGNPLACTCATLSFVRWLGTTQVALDTSLGLECLTDAGLLSNVRVEGRDWMVKWRRCVGPTTLWSAMALLLLMTSLTGLMWGVTKNITRLCFLFIVLRHIRMPQRNQFACDAYVAYCDEDKDFVCGRLRRELGVRRSVRLLIKHLPVDAAATRYWQLPGENKPFKILKHIELSWKIILVLTPALARDDMAGFMMHAALQSVTDVMPRRVLLLYVGQRRLPRLASVQALLETVPENQVFFLPHPATPHHQQAVWDAMAQIILE
jgi:hypothetical protein